MPSESSIAADPVVSSLARPSASSLPRVPLLAPDPPRLSQNTAALERIELSGIYSNYGPVNTEFERQLIHSMFREGACVTVCNATIGLMLAIREVIGDECPPQRKYALMPSFTFAATAQAADWNGLTPLFCDIDPATWLPCRQSMMDLMQQFEGEIAVIVPYATFGNNLDLRWYEQVAERHNVPLVIDAAASLGSLDDRASQFGSGCPWPVVFSMHATKVFSVGEGGVIYSGDEERIRRLRSMGSFGFEGSRSAKYAGLNAKMRRGLRVDGFAPAGAVSGDCGPAGAARAAV